MIKINKQWKFKESYPTVSAYTTTYNCLKGGYPFEEFIKSFSWVDQLIVVDGGSDDGTKEALEEIAIEFPNIEVYEIPINWDNPGKDGEQKAIARAMCTNEFLIQFDADEKCGGSPLLWKKLIKDFPDSVKIINLLVVEPFGDKNNIRLNKEHNPVKWRISRNESEISHGIPEGDRAEKDGKVFSKGNSDGCFPVHIVTNQLYRSYTPAYLTEIAELKELARENDKDKERYKKLILETMEAKPFVYHAGHVNLENKIRLYLRSWHQWWNYLYNKDHEDPKNNLYFPDVKTEDVTEEMIKEKVKELKQTTPTIELGQ